MFLKYPIICLHVYYYSNRSLPSPRPRACLEAMQPNLVLPLGISKAKCSMIYRLKASFAKIPNSNLKLNNYEGALCG